MHLPHIYIHNNDVHVQQRFWARVNESKEGRDRMQQICGGVVEVEARIGSAVRTIGGMSETVL